MYGPQFHLILVYHIDNSRYSLSLGVYVSWNVCDSQNVVRVKTLPPANIPVIFKRTVKIELKKKVSFFLLFYN